MKIKTMHIHFMMWVWLLIAIAIVEHKVSKIQRDVEHLVIMMDSGVCESAE